MADGRLELTLYEQEISGVQRLSVLVRTQCSLGILIRQSRKLMAIMKIQF